jgi:hypothetical protein
MEVNRLLDVPTALTSGKNSPLFIGKPLLLKCQPHFLVAPGVITKEALTTDNWQGTHNICFWHREEMPWCMSVRNHHGQGICPLFRVADPHGQLETTHCLLNVCRPQNGYSRMPLDAGHAARHAPVWVGCTSRQGSRLKNLTWKSNEPPVWSSGQSSWLRIPGATRFPEK